MDKNKKNNETVVNSDETVVNSDETTNKFNIRARDYKTESTPMSDEQPSDEDVICKFMEIKQNPLYTKFVNSDTHIEGNIYRTNDYSKFNLTKENRDINIAHKNRLKKAIMINDLMERIKVCIRKDKQVVIIDGQHRFTAYSELGYKFLYEVISNVQISDVQEMNNLTKHWNRDDIAKYMLNYTGNSAYAIYLDLVKTYRFSSHVANSILVGYHVLQKREDSFMSGTLEEGDKDEREALIARLMQFRDIGVRFYKSRYFVFAIMAIIKAGIIDIDELILCIQNNFTMIRKVPRISEYVDLLEKIYNKGKAKRTSIIPKADKKILKEATQK